MTVTLPTATNLLFLLQLFISAGKEGVPLDTFLDAVLSETGQFEIADLTETVRFRASGFKCLISGLR